MKFHKKAILGPGRPMMRQMSLRARPGTRLNSPRKEQHEENDDQQAGTAADVMIAGTEAITASANEQ